MAAMDIDLPIVDLKKAQDPVQRRDVAKKLVHALETVGFLYIDNVEGLDSQKLLTNTRWFFALPEEEKDQLSRRQWNPFSRNRYRGYFPLQEGEVSYKEGFEIGQEIPPDDYTVHPFFNEPNVWPLGLPGARQFHSDMVEYYYAATHCGAEILRLVSLGCGLGEEWFEAMFFPNSLSTLRLLHYPARHGDVPDEAVDDGRVLCCSEHSDSGFVTLLDTFSYKGLQIRLEGGQWLDVPCRPGSLIMNIGDMLSNISAGRFKATRHRVIDTGVDRLSVPFFFEPNYDADISCVMPPRTAESQEQQDYVRASKSPGGTRYGLWLIEKMRSFAEYRDILDEFKFGASASRG